MRPKSEPPGARARSSRRRAAFVYVLRCADGTLYTGAAQDVAARLARHQAGRASRYTRARLPVTLVWSRGCASWSAALSEEARVKKLRRADKEALIAAAPRQGRRSGGGAHSSARRRPSAG
jgi:putative endonuclease